MKVLTDDNFLGGTLTIVSKSNCKTTVGKLLIYDGFIDEFTEFVATTSCKNDDIFNTQTGIKIVKLKLAKQFYKYKKYQNKLIINKFSKPINDANQNINYINKKLEHIQFELKKF